MFKTFEDKMSLANLGGGAAIEKFDIELEKVLDNILDPNTKTKARKIVLSVTLMPDERRDTVTILIDCDSKLSPAEGFASLAYIGKRDGKPEAHERIAQQRALFDNVTDIHDRERRKS